MSVTRGRRSDGATATEREGEMSPCRSALTPALRDYRRGRAAKIQNNTAASTVMRPPAIATVHHGKTMEYAAARASFISSSYLFHRRSALGADAGDVAG